MSKKLSIPLGLKVVTVINLLAIPYILLEFYRGGYITYFFSLITMPPMSFLVIIFDLFLLVGAILAVFKRSLWWWKVGFLNYGYGLLTAGLVVLKIFFGPKSGVSTSSEFVINLLVYVLTFLFYLGILSYWYSQKTYFSAKK